MDYGHQWKAGIKEKKGVEEAGARTVSRKMSYNNGGSLPTAAFLPSFVLAVLSVLLGPAASESGNQRTMLEGKNACLKEWATSRGWRVGVRQWIGPNRL